MRVSSVVETQPEITSTQGIIERANLCILIIKSSTVYDEHKIII
jgi:hypothetical protein